MTTEGITVGSLFSGIGGLEMGLESCGVGPVLWQCDSDPYARAVLEDHWPTVRRYNDVREIDGNAARVDLVCGGFPCQPHSVAGKRRGTSDARWLWPEFARILEALRPSFVFIENVPGLRTSGLRIVLADLARLGFDAEWGLFSAAEVGALHVRRRLFLLAYANCLAQRIQSGRSGGKGRPGAAIAGDHGALRDMAHAASDGWREGQRFALAEDEAPNGGWDRVTVGADAGGNAWSIEPNVGRVADGVPARAHRLRLLGNAVVPRQAALAFRSLSRASYATPGTPLP